MNLIVGLGNPGAEYDFTPHNLGFAAVDRLAVRNSVLVTRKQSQSLCGRWMLGEREVWLVKPQTFMNLSGVSVKDWILKQDAEPKGLLVIADDLDLPWGALRIRPEGGAGGHHGLESIIDSIGSKLFARVRIGVRPEHPISDTVDYLLSPVKRSQRSEWDEIVDRAAQSVETILNDGMAVAMNRFNQKPAGQQTEKKAPKSAEGKE
jgi:PTH1 family peptidyl-tRNA hydrolase